MKKFTKECETECTEGCETKCIKEVEELTSIIIESQEDKTKMIALYGLVEEEKCEELVSSLIVLEALIKEESQEPVKFLISSEGGSAYEMFSVYDSMRALKKKTPVETIGLGKVMSAAVLLLAAGTKGERKIGKNCRVMIHDVKAGQSGAVGHMENELAEVKMLQRMYIDCLAEETNLTAQQIRKWFKRGVNIYLSAEQVVEYGIADIIV